MQLCWLQCQYPDVTKPIRHGYQPLATKHTAIQGQQKQNPKRLPNVEARFYCRQANLNLYFQCRDDAFKLKEMFLGFRRAAHTWKS